MIAPRRGVRTGEAARLRADIVLDLSSGEASLALQQAAASRRTPRLRLAGARFELERESEKGLRERCKRRLGCVAVCIQ